MHKRSLGIVLAAVLFAALGGAAPAAAADEYAVDPVHSSVTFKISHLGLAWVHGRFNSFSGGFVIDTADPAKSSFNLAIKAESVDSGNNKRDDHLRSPDFFNVKQFPALSFKSTAVKTTKDGYEVTGDLTMHGVTKSITFPLVGGRTAEFPRGFKRTGYTTELTLKRSEFGMDKMTEAIGDEVAISVSFEGTKK
jgi:polyisoprenoid-binding protein YceI